MAAFYPQQLPRWNHRLIPELDCAADASIRTESHALDKGSTMHCFGEYMCDNFTAITGAFKVRLCLIEHDEEIAQLRHCWSEEKDDLLRQIADLEKNIKIKVDQRVEVGNEGLWSVSIDVKGYQSMLKDFCVSELSM